MLAYLKRGQRESCRKQPQPSAGQQTSSRSGSAISPLPPRHRIHREKVSRAARLPPILHRSCVTICWASPCCLENHFPKPPPSISGALSADGHIPSTGAHDAGVPRANPSLARPEQRRSPRTCCGDGAAHAAEIPSHAFAASLGASLSPAPWRGERRRSCRQRSRLPPGTRHGDLGSASSAGREYLWIMCISSKCCRADPVCWKTGWVGWVYMLRVHHCTSEEEQHHQPHPQNQAEITTACLCGPLPAERGCKGA